jgi:ribosome-binding factor A
MGNSLDPEELIVLMNRNIKEYRFHLGKELQLKYVPQIKFYHDNTFEEMEKISKLIHKTKEENGSKTE